MHHMIYIYSNEYASIVAFLAPQLQYVPISTVLITAPAQQTADVPVSGSFFSYNCIVSGKLLGNTNMFFKMFESLLKSDCFKYICKILNIELLFFCYYLYSQRKHMPFRNDKCLTYSWCGKDLP